jgi:hypothetical protein
MSKPLVTNAANEEQIKEAEFKVNDARDQELDDIRYLLQSHQGRRFFWRLLGKCYENENTFDTNALIQSFKNGTRNVGLFVKSEIIQANEDAYLKMMKESKEGKL